MKELVIYTYLSNRVDEHGYIYVIDVPITYPFNVTLDIFQNTMEQYFLSQSDTFTGC